MKILDVKKNENNLDFVVAVDSKEWEQQILETQKKLAKNVDIKGFRKGKVPFEMAKKHLNMSSVISHSLEKIIDPVKKQIEESKEFVEGKEVLVEIPSVKVNKIDEKNLELTYTYDYYPTVTLKDYKKIKIDSIELKKVTNDDVENEINRILKHHKVVTTKTDGKLAKGDVAIIDFIGYKDGEKFSGGEGKDFELEIGSNKFVPGFEDQLIGMNVNETKKIQIKFPKDYFSKELANADVEFDVTLKEIKLVELPKLDDEFVKHENIKDVNTVAEFKKFIKEQIQKQYDLNYKDQITKEIINYIISITELSSFPKFLVDSQKERIIQSFQQQLSHQKITIDKYLQLSNISKEEFDKNIESSAKDSLKYGLAAEQIAKENKLEITDKEVDEYINKISLIYKISSDDIKKQLNNNFEPLKEQLLNDKIIDNLIEWNQKNINKK